MAWRKYAMRYGDYRDSSFSSEHDDGPEIRTDQSHCGSHSGSFRANGTMVSITSTVLCTGQSA